jgi:hypothetical protein
MQTPATTRNENTYLTKQKLTYIILRRAKYNEPAQFVVTMRRETLCYNNIEDGRLHLDGANDDHKTERDEKCRCNEVRHCVLPKRESGQIGAWSSCRRHV